LSSIEDFFAATGGGVRICPEPLTAPGARKGGRIGFYVPGGKWGIELTREGKGLSEHSSRFDLTGVWLTSNDMVDYIHLDCRTDMRKSPNPSKYPFVLHLLYQLVLNGIQPLRHF